MARECDIEQVNGYEFQFTRNWFRNRNLPTFREYILPEWGGKPITYLELGVFEGMSMVWMLQRVLTHPDSRGVGVDPWLMTRKIDACAMDDVRQRAFHNTDPFANCFLQRGTSAEVLRKVLTHGFLGLKANTVDLCMVDGNHNALAVLDDLRLVNQIVKPGGWILLDDVENDRPKKDHVEEGLRAWLREPEAKVKLVFKHRYVECYQKE